MKEFLLVLESDRSVFDSMSAEEQSAQIARYNEWVGGLIEKNLFKDGLGLAPGHYTINPNKEMTVDGPYTESKEVITGQFKILAESYEQAIEIGKTCPALKCGEKVMVFQVGGA